MGGRRRILWIIAAAVTVGCLFGPAPDSWGKEKKGKEVLDVVEPNDATLRLFQILDTNYGGKLKDMYVVADVQTDRNNPSREVQRVLRVEYDKARAYGRLNIYSRVVDKLGAEQLQSYTPQLIYDYGGEDVEKYTKTEPGRFGRTGDTFCLAKTDSPLVTSPVTDDVRKAYETLVTQYLMPALQKK